MNAIGSTRRFLFVAALALLPTLVGCEKRVDQSEGATDGNSVPLKASGLSSAEELRRDLSGLDAVELKKAYDRAFRRAFSSKVALRNYPEAIRMVNRIITERPAYAPAYRVLGYSLFNTGRASEALAAYKQAVHLDPDYGEAHYALAFMFAMGDRAVGREHFQKAMALGVNDERNLAEQFYPPEK